MASEYLEKLTKDTNNKYLGNLAKKALMLHALGFNKISEERSLLHWFGDKGGWCRDLDLSMVNTCCSVRHCDERAIYAIGYANLCFSCAVDSFWKMNFFCEVCGNIFRLRKKSVGMKSKICYACRERYRNELSVVISNNRRTKESEAGISLSEWIDIIRDNNHKCVYCGDKYESMDHVVPVSSNGRTTKENVVPCCKSCNSRKGSKPLDDLPLFQR